MQSNLKQLQSWKDKYPRIGLIERNKWSVYKQQYQQRTNYWRPKMIQLVLILPAIINRSSANLIWSILSLTFLIPCYKQTLIFNVYLRITKINLKNQIQNK